tara:strand:- start:2003 stop:3958 length:1956 start_codon:yes stop_codon:yes gene_type:complete
MIRLPLILIITLFFTVFSFNSMANNELNLNDVSSFNFKSYFKPVLFQLSVGGNEFSLIQVEQNGKDLLVKLYNSKGKLINQINNNSSENGSEFIEINSFTTEVCKVEVYCLDGNLTSSSTIRYLRKEPIAKTFKGKVDQFYASFDLPKSPGLAIAVIKDGNVLYKKNYGLSNIARSRKITPDVRFNLASVSKQFTAYAVLQLEQAGKINLKNEVSAYLKDAPLLWKGITVEDLLLHKSGIREWWYLMVLKGREDQSNITNQEILDLLFKQNELNFGEGNGYSYTNSGYNILAKIIENVSGQKFSEYMQLNVFSPLGMKTAFIADSPIDMKENIAISYEAEKIGFDEDTLSFSAYGSSNVYASLNDCISWAKHIQKTMNTPNSIIYRMIKNPRVTNENLSYGYGLELDKYKGEYRFYHEGDHASYRPEIETIRDHSLSVIILSNSNEVYRLQKGREEILDYYLNKKSEKKRKIIEYNPLSITDSTLEGVYEFNPWWRCKVSREGMKLIAQFDDGEIILHPNSSNRLFGENGTNITLKLKRNGQVKGKVSFGNRSRHKVRKIHLQDNDSINEEIIGEYYSEELELTVRIVRSDPSRILITIPGYPSYELFLLYDNTYITDCPFIQRIILSNESGKKGIRVKVVMNEPVEFVRK